ncbi:YdhK family protein [Aestuariimicrobium soli]|uniref:YdhK family protein n=1 Tax=Aestuariimicrobium soli TaxID=2035834 RepID=UPI003EBAA725
MRTRIKAAIAAAILVGALALTGCTSDHQGHGSSSSASSTSSTSGEMDHPMDGGPAPAGIKEAPSPTYPVGTKVTLKADHMDGMKGAEATIVGAFDTHTYAVNFTPTTGGEPITDHRWVVQEELEGVGDELLPEGATVTLDAAHMTGMKGAEATIASSTSQTVYMVDYTWDGMTITNHKWVVESEIQPAS